MVSESLESFMQYLDGKGAGTDDTEVDPIQLEIGTLVEHEHSSNGMIAKRIAIDHLVEHPDYYTKLVKAGLVDEKPALEAYRKHFGNR